MIQRTSTYPKQVYTIVKLMSLLAKTTTRTTIVLSYFSWTVHVTWVLPEWTAEWPSCNDAKQRECGDDGETLPVRCMHSKRNGVSSRQKCE